MRFSRSALLALPATALAVTLSDFTPRVSNLPASCKAVYTQSIDGCQASDFQGTCSSTCVQALGDLTADVESACANKGITGSNIIVAFLGGDGPASLCGDAADILSRTSSSHAATSTSSKSSSPASSATSTSSSTSTAASTTSSAAAASTQTVTATSSSASSSSSAILADSTTLSPSSTTTGHRSSQTDMTNSGGGSPFDAEGNTVSGASALSTMSWTTTIIATILALAFTLL